MFPATACLVQHKLGTRTWGFDVSAGCSAFLTRSSWSASSSRQGLQESAGDRVRRESSITDYTDRALCVIFGDGAGAVLLGAGEREWRVGVIDHVATSRRARAAALLYMPGGGSLNPSPTKPSTRKCTTSTRTGSSLQVRGAARWRKSEPSLPSQQSDGQDIDALSLTRRMAHHYRDRRSVGNAAPRTSSSTSTVTATPPRPRFRWPWRRPADDGKLKKGSLVMLASVGSGFTVGASLLRWAY